MIDHGLPGQIRIVSSISISLWNQSVYHYGINQYIIMESIVLPLGHMRFGECCEPLTEIPQVKRMLARYGKNGQQKNLVPSNGPGMGRLSPTASAYHRMRRTTRPVSNPHRTASPRLRPSYRSFLRVRTDPGIRAAPRRSRGR